MQWACLHAAVLCVLLLCGWCRLAAVWRALPAAVVVAAAATAAVKVASV
jgi:hypothetical protein